MSESAFRTEFCLLTAELDPVPIENMLCGKTGVGTPDVNIIPGWVELKWLPSYPKRETTPVRIDHYTDQQREWLLRRVKMGGGAWLSLKVRSNWYVFDADGAQDVGRLTRAELEETAIAFFPKKPTAEELCRVFTT